MMDTDEFEALLLAHGPDLERWPKDRRAGATALIAGDPVARRAIAQMAALETTVNEAVSLPADPAMAARIVAEATRDKAAFELTFGRLAATLATVLGIGGAGYVAASVLSGLVAPAGLVTGLTGVAGPL